MKINNIKALDYQAQGNGLVMILAETDLEEITGMDTALLRVETDEGDLVEALAGHRLVRATYEAADGTFAVTLEQGAGDTTAAALKALTEALAEAEKRYQAQQEQLEEQADALMELAGLLAGEEE